MTFYSSHWYSSMDFIEGNNYGPNEWYSVCILIFMEKTVILSFGKTFKYKYKYKWHCDEIGKIEIWHVPPNSTECLFYEAICWFWFWTLSCKLTILCIQFTNFTKISVWQPKKKNLKDSFFLTPIFFDFMLFFNKKKAKHEHTIYSPLRHNRRKPTKIFIQTQ